MADKVGGIEFDVSVSTGGADSAAKQVDQATQRMEGAFGKVDKAASKTGKAATETGKAMGGLGRNAGMAGIQLQQFFGQIQGGQSALLALSQQGADLGFVLGRAGLGAAVGIAATAVSFLIPVLSNSGSEVSDLKNKIKELGEEITKTANIVRFLADENNKAMTEMSKSNVDLAEKIKKSREELEKMQAAGSGLDAGDFAVPRSAEENQKRYNSRIKETKERINALTAELDLNNQEMLKLSNETENLSKKTEGGSKKAHDYTIALYSQVIALQHGAKAAEIYASSQAAIASGNEEQLPLIIELINRKYELKEAQEQAAEATRNEIIQQRALSKEMDDFFKAEDARAAKKAKEKESNMGSATSNVDQFRLGLMTEEALRQEYYDRELAQFRASAEILGLTKDEIRALEEQKAKQHADKLSEIEAKSVDQKIQQAENEKQQKLGYVSQTFSAVASLMNTGSKKLFEIGKAAAIGSAIVDGYAAVSKTMASVPYPFNIPLAAAQGIASAAQVQGIAKQKFGGAGGGANVFSAGMPAVNTTSSQSQQRTQNVDVYLTGDNFSRSGISGLIDTINDYIGDGGTKIRVN